MYTKNYILQNILKFQICESEIISNKINKLSKGNLTISFDDATDYFILKDILLLNNCISNEVLNNIYSKLQLNCSQCNFRISTSPVTGDVVIRFGIITEYGIPIISENNLYLIQE